jgi:cytidine deaminase
MVSLSEHEKLLEEAEAVRRRAYAPYSHYLVGAAVLGHSGQIYAGCNVENASYGLSICAERAAIFKAVSAGERELVALAVVTSNGGTPCGACRQVFFEFAKADSKVVIADTQGQSQRIFTIGELLAEGFGPDKLPPNALSH